MFKKKQPVDVAPPPPVPSAPAQGRRKVADPDASLRADAIAASEILASYSDWLSPEAVLLHPELAALAVAQAKAAVAGDSPEQANERIIIENAVTALAAAHSKDIKAAVL